MLRIRISNFTFKGSRTFKTTSLNFQNPSILCLKVGYIKECIKHPEADKLYVSKIITDSNLMESKLIEGFHDYLTVCSGLVNHIPINQMINRKVVLLTNLKASKMRGIKSQAMILCAEQINNNNNNNDDDEIKVEIINPPISSQIGDLLYFKPFINNKEPSNLKIKNWEIIQSRLFTDNKGMVVYKDDDEKFHKLSGFNSDVAYVDNLKDAIVR